jgi:ankyrin repeat protein
VNVNAVHCGRTLIDRSIEDRKLELTQRLIEYGAELIWNYTCGIDTALHRAAYTKQPQIVELLLDAGVPIDSLDRNEETAIEIAAERGDREMVAVLLSRGATVSIHVAAAIGDLQTIADYLLTGGDPNLRLGSGYGCPPLFVAAAHDRIDAAKLLIKAGAQMNLDCCQDDFDILAACRHGSPEMVELLVANGSRTDLFNIGGDMLWNAARYGRTDIVRLAIEEYNLSADKHDPYPGYLSYAPAGAAASSGNIETLEFLVSKGASIPDSAIYQAAENGHFEMVKFLAERKVEPDFKAFGDSAIVKAACQKDLPMVQTLLSVGADVNAGVDTESWTALHWAAKAGDLEMVRLLVKAGAEVNAGISGWLRPLELAGGKRHDDVIEFLVMNGARG